MDGIFLADDQPTVEAMIEGEMSRAGIALIQPAAAGPIAHLIAMGDRFQVGITPEGRAFLVTASGRPTIDAIREIMTSHFSGYVAIPSAAATPEATPEAVVA